MKRDLAKLASQDYDLIIIGCGINGAACAWDATLRGLRVAVLDQDDFGGRTSSQSFKIAHSGLRYLQHADFPRMRRSVREGIIMRKNAPHLLKAQPFLMPLYGHGIKGREVVSIYMKLFDLFSMDKGWSSDPYRRIPGTKILSSAQVQEIFPEVKTDGLTGGAIWYEGQMNNTERLLFSYVASAAERGAQFANYAKVDKLIREGNTITGVEVTDAETGTKHTVKARCVLNAAGPWAVKTLQENGAELVPKGVHLSKALSFVTRPLTKGHAVTFSCPPMYQDQAAVVNKGSSMHFAAPWRGDSLLGSLHMACEDDPDKVTITDQEIDGYLDMINKGWPGAEITRKDIKHILWGMIPADEAGSAAPGKKYRLVDHKPEDGVDGLVTVVGVKYTTARAVAQKAIDMVAKKLGNTSKCQTAETVLWGGDIELMNDFTIESKARHEGTHDPRVIQQLIDTYGSEFSRVLEYSSGNPQLAEELADTGVVGAQILYAVEQEAARTLSDVLLRRTPMGSLTVPPMDAVQRSADLMAEVLKWSEDEKQGQMAELLKAYPRFILPSEIQGSCLTH